MTNTQRNWALVLGVVLTFGAGGATGRATAQCPPTEIKLPQIPPCEVTVHVEPCICDVDVTADPAPTCPEVRFVVPGEDEDKESAGAATQYRLDLILTGNDEGGRAAVAWNRWQRFRPVIGAVYTKGRDHGSRYERSQWHDRRPLVPAPDYWKVEAGVVIGLWKR